MKTFLSPARWGATLGAAFLTATMCVAAETVTTTNSNKLDASSLTYQNAMNANADNAGLNGIFAIFFFLMVVCLLICLGNAAIGITSFMRTNEYKVLQDKAVGVGAFFALFGVFLWIASKASNGSGVLTQLGL